MFALPDGKALLGGAALGLGLSTMINFFSLQSQA
jgi:hypothetical protein